MKIHIKSRYPYSLAKMKNADNTMDWIPGAPLNYWSGENGKTSVESSFTISYNIKFIFCTWANNPIPGYCSQKNRNLSLHQKLCIQKFIAALFTIM
jgi:hypothetical protein